MQSFCYASPWQWRRSSLTNWFTFKARIRVAARDLQKNCIVSLWSGRCATMGLLSRVTVEERYGTARANLLWTKERPKDALARGRGGHGWFTNLHRAERHADRPWAQTVRSKAASCCTCIGIVPLVSRYYWLGSYPNLKLSRQDASNGQARNRFHLNE